MLRIIAFFEIALRLQNAQILSLNSWKSVPAHLNELMQLQELYRDDHSSATFSMVAPDAISVAHF